MKNRISLFTIAVAALSSCSVTKYYVADDYRLQSVDNSICVSDIKSGDNNYEDDYINATITFGTSGIAINLTNLANSSLKIYWDDASFIDQFGNAHRVIHTGTKLVDRDKAQVPSVVPKGASISDEVVPSDCISWTEATKYTAGQWVYKPISQMVRYDTQEQAEQAMAMSSKGTPQLLLPMEINGTRYEYMFKFASNGSSIEYTSEVDSEKTLWAICGVSGVALLIELIILSNI